MQAEAILDRPMCCNVPPEPHVPAHWHAVTGFLQIDLRDPVRAREEFQRLIGASMKEPSFKCPKCGSSHFGRDIGKDCVPLDTVRCHGDIGGKGKGWPMCDWRGVWPPKEEEKSDDAASM